MLQQKSLDVMAAKYQSLGVQIPSLHVVLGSGFGQALEHLAPTEWAKVGEIGFAEIPGLTASTVQDHAGTYRVYRHTKSGKIVQFQMGRLHGYEGHPSRAVVNTVMIPRLLGVEKFVLTNAAGGLLPGMKPGDVMIIKDHVNLTGTNPLFGENPKHPNGQEIGPRFPDMGNTYQSEWRARLEPKLKAQGLGVHEGVYLGLMGPTFETHAEVRLFASWGMGSVGMSTVWEAIALKHSGAKLCGVSLISNLGAGLSDVQLDHTTILETCRNTASRVLTGLTQFAAEDLLK